MTEYTRMQIHIQFNVHKCSKKTVCINICACIQKAACFILTDGQPVRTQSQPSLPYNQAADTCGRDRGRPPTRADTKSELVPIVQTHRTTRTHDKARTQLMKHITQNTDML